MQKQLQAPSSKGLTGFARRIRKAVRNKTIAAGFLIAGSIFSAAEGQAQNIILSEDFETGGATWTIVNGTQTNKWFVGTATAAASTQSAYISNDGGVTNAYNITTTSFVHLYKDVVIPAAQKNIQLTFKWKAQGEGTSSNDWDNLKVFLAPAGTTVTDGIAMSSTFQIGAAFYNFSPAGAYTTTTINLPSSYAGSTRRLVFTWKNDETTGTQPPVSVDDIVLSSVNANPLSGVYTINNTLPTGGTNFASFTDAITLLNSEGISGPVTFNVSAGQTFTENTPVITASGTVSNSITFQKSGAGANPVIRPTGTTAAAEGGIVISGGDYFTFDGIDININTGSALEYGYAVRNANALDGAMNNTIRNAKITLNKANTSSIGVIQTSSSTGGGVTPTALIGTNQNNTFHNLIIESVYNGILLISGTGAFPDNNTQVHSNTVGGATAGDLGGSSTTAYGIKATLQNNVKIFDNQIRNITTTTAAIDGLFLDQGIGLSEIYNNKIGGLALSTATGTAVITGMRLNTYTSTSGNNTRVYNNFIFGLSHPFVGTASATRRIIGIIVQSNGSGTGNTQNIDFNSVRIEPAAAYTASSTTFEIGTTSGPVINVRNNIFANFMGAQTGVAKHYVWVSTATNLIGNTGSVSDNNLLFLANTTNGFIGLANTTDVATLIAWRNTMNQDLNSKNSNPQFVSATDLHINPAVPTEVESNGSFFGGAISWASNDIDGNPRNATNPDLGADEGTFTFGDFTGPTIVISSFLTNTSSTADRTVTATISDASGVPTTGALVPRIYFSKDGGANWFSNPGTIATGTATNGTWNFTISGAAMGGVTQGTRIFYFIVAQDVNGNISGLPNTVVATNVNTVTSVTTAFSYFINAPIAPNITVPGTYPSLTNTGGLFEAINQGVLNGNVIVNITADLTAETGTIALNQWIEEGAGNYTLNIRPDAAVNRTISGSSAAGVGLIRLNGADRVTIDGSFGGTGKFLTITNTNTVANTFALLVSAGSVNNTFRNLNVSTGGNAISATVGIFSSGQGISNLLIENNNISKAYYGILSQNDANVPATNVRILNNVIGSSIAADQVTIRGIWVTNASGPIISGNTINMQTTLATTMAAIDLGTNVTNAQVSKNTISGIKTTGSVGAIGIFISSNVGVNNITIDNNMISDILAPGVASSISNPLGIRLDGGSNVKLYYNSINMTGALTVTGAARTAALYVNSTALTGLDVRNNIFANSMTGAATAKSYGVYAISGVTFNTINFNNYFTSGANAVLGFLGSDKLTLAEWRTATGQDVNSISVDPQFMSATDLHITTSNLSLNNLGTPIATVTTDIDNDVRSATTPDMGADEFTPASLDLGAFALVSPVNKICFGATEQVTVAIKNLGITPINFAATNATLTVTATVPTGATPPTLPVISFIDNSLNGGNPLAVGATLNVPIGTINMTTPGAYTFNAVTNVISGGMDGNQANDAIDPVTITVAPLAAGTATAVQASICQSGTTTINLVGNSGGDVQWQTGTTATGPFTNISGASSSSFTLPAAITQTTYYQAVVSCGTNLATSNIVTVTVNNPAITASAGATRCGAGTVSLSATPSPNASINWYADATGGAPLATGPTFSPTVSTTTTFYAEANEGGLTTNVGATSNAIGTGAQSTATHYLFFDALTAFTLNSVYVYPNAAGNVVIELRNSANTILQTATVAVTAAQVGVKTLIPVNFAIAPGTGYKIGRGSASVSLYRNETGAVYPYTVPGVLSITGNSFNPTYYYWAYDWNISSGCGSARTAIIATVNPDPAPAFNGLATTYCSTDPAVTLVSSISGSTFTINGTAATTFNPATLGAGSHTVIVSSTNASSCTGTATQTVTVTAPAATPTITAGGATTLCSGGSVTLTAASTTTGATYEWFLNGTAIPGATSATYTANATGNYTAVATANGCPSATSAATTVTLNPTAAVPTIAAGGPVSFCSGGSVTLTATSTTTGATYTWFLNGSPIAGATAATYTANAAGNYTAVATATGCPSAASAATAVTVNAPAALPTIAAGGPTTFCAGGSVALTAASTTTGATFTWFLNGTPITGATAATYTANAAGNYTAVATANGCPSAASAGTTVTVNALPATPTIAQNGGILTSSAATGNQWYLNGTLIPGATGQNYTTAANGGYTVITTGTNGCASTASAVKNVTNTGLNAALAEMGIQVYPNPNNGSFNVKLTGYQKDATITLYNLAGQLIATETVKASNTDQNVKAMNLKGLAAGTYLLKVMSDKGTQVTRLVVE